MMLFFVFVVDVDVFLLHGRLPMAYVFVLRRQLVRRPHCLTSRLAHHLVDVKQSNSRTMSTPLNTDMEPKHGGVLQMIFLLKGVIFSWTSRQFSGVKEEVRKPMLCPGSSAPQSPLDEVDGLGLELKGQDKLILGKIITVILVRFRNRGKAK